MVTVSNFISIFSPILHFTLLIFLAISMSMKYCDSGNIHGAISQGDYIGVVTV